NIRFDLQTCPLAPPLARRRKNNHVVTTKNFKNFFSSGTRVRVTRRAYSGIDRELAPLPRSLGNGRDRSPGSRFGARHPRALLPERARPTQPLVDDAGQVAVFNHNPDHPRDHLFFNRHANRRDQEVIRLGSTAAPGSFRRLVLGPLQRAAKGPSSLRENVLRRLRTCRERESSAKSWNI